jgi:hypothetical protein
MASIWSLTVVTFIYLINFCQATYSASGRINLALYWVCLHLLQKISILILCRDKDLINNAYFISVSNLPSISLILPLSIFSLLRGMDSQVTISETNATVHRTSMLDQVMIHLSTSFNPNVQIW